MTKTPLGDRLTRAGRVVSGIVWGTFFALLLLFLIYAVARALWP